MGATREGNAQLSYLGWIIALRLGDLAESFSDEVDFEVLCLFCRRTLLGGGCLREVLIEVDFLFPIAARRGFLYPLFFKPALFCVVFLLHVTFFFQKGQVT